MPPGTAIEERVWRAFADGTVVDVRPRRRPPDDLRHGAEWGPERQVRAAFLVDLLTGCDAPEPAGVSALRLAGVAVTGELRLEAAQVPYLVELTECWFSHAPDLRMARFAGLRLPGCRVPGLRGRNLVVESDLVLEAGFTAHGQVDLSDAQVDGSLRLTAAVLRAPARRAVAPAAGLASRLRSGLTPRPATGRPAIEDDGGRDRDRDLGAALVAERAIIGGSMQASVLRAVGAVRIPNSRIGGNVELAGARLSNPPGDALHAVGVEVSGSVAGDLVADGRVVLAGARVGGDLRLSGARLTVATPDNLPGVVTPRGSIDDTGASLVADRVDVRGNVELDDGFTAAGVVRLPAASIGGYLRLSGSRLGTPDRPAGQFPVALLADGARIGGDLDARAARGAEDSDGRHGPLVAHGQVRLVDAHVRGSASLSGVRLHGSGLDVLFADRLHIGSTLFLRAARVRGSIRLQNADIGSTLDCTGAVVTDPRVRPDGTSKPSVDARVAAVGKDVLCSRGFVATGGVRLRRAEVGKSVNFEGATLGGAPHAVALNAFGLRTQEFNVRFAEPPVGEVLLTRAETVSVADSAHLWHTRGRVDIEDFTYQALAAHPDVDVRTRLAWLGRVVTHYDPDPYEQLAAMYADAGREERSRRVLLVNQRRRHAAMKLPGRVLGWLQEVTVGYGYRPMLTVVWFLGAWALGSWWFTRHYTPQLIDPENQPIFNGVLFALDTLLPIVNVGQDQHWQVSGASQWVAAVLTLVGWVLASTAAAGATRVLKRG